MSCLSTSNITMKSTSSSLYNFMHICQSKFAKLSWWYFVPISKNNESSHVFASPKLQNANYKNILSKYLWIIYIYMSWFYYFWYNHVNDLEHFSQLNSFSTHYRVTKQYYNLFFSQLVCRKGVTCILNLRWFFGYVRVFLFRVTQKNYTYPCREKINLEVMSSVDMRVFLSLISQDRLLMRKHTRNPQKLNGLKLSLAFWRKYIIGHLLIQILNFFMVINLVLKT